MRKSIVLYDSWGELIRNLPTDAAGALIQMICQYSFGGDVEPSGNDLIDAMYMMIKSKLDEDAEAYDETVKKRSEAGKKGMGKRWSDNNAITEDNNDITNDNSVITNDNTVKQKITNITDSVSVSDSVSESDNKKRERRARFTPPTLDEVKDYCSERNNSVDPETFIDFYSSKGWKVGAQPMKDWKASVRTWEKRDNRGSPDKSEDKFDINAYLLKEMGADTG